MALGNVIGNVIGSNIFNIPGITALVQPMSAPAGITGFEIRGMCAAGLALRVFARTGRTISRRERALCRIACAIYLASLLLL